MTALDEILNLLKGDHSSDFYKEFKEPLEEVVFLVGVEKQEEDNASTAR